MKGGWKCIGVNRVKSLLKFGVSVDVSAWVNSAW
jgi:hypothetical protein